MTEDLHQGLGDKGEGARVIREGIVDMHEHDHQDGDGADAVQVGDAIGGGRHRGMSQREIHRNFGFGLQ